ncbi:MAG: phosphoglycerate mutase, partial [Bacteroidetes bacterium]|nr:phosphoglycerate mutase [Candidatus Caccoplasma merdipullorum]
DVTVALLPDHPTPCRIRTHSSDAVPFVIWKPGMEPDGVTVYDEESAKQGGYGTIAGHDFIETLFKK